MEDRLDTILRLMGRLDLGLREAEARELALALYDELQTIRKLLEKANHDSGSA